LGSVFLSFVCVLRLASFPTRIAVLLTSIAFSPLRGFVVRRATLLKRAFPGRTFVPNLVCPLFPSSPPYSLLPLATTHLSSFPPALLNQKPPLKSRRHSPPFSWSESLLLIWAVDFSLIHLFPRSEEVLYSLSPLQCIMPFLNQRFPGCRFILVVAFLNSIFRLDPQILLLVCISLSGSFTTLVILLCYHGYSDNTFEAALTTLPQVNRPLSRPFPGVAGPLSNPDIDSWLVVETDATFSLSSSNQTGRVLLWLVPSPAPPSSILSS